VVVALAATAGCGGGAARAQSGYRGGGGGGAAATSSYGGSSGYGGDYGGESDDAEYAPSPDAAPAREEVHATATVVEEATTAETTRAIAPAAAPPRYAQATPRASATREQAQAQETATDAVDTSGPLLIYTATFHLAVYEVHESQERIAAAAREAGGFVFAQSDDRLVVRVPSARFRAMLEAIEASGDVEHRDVQAQDVSEEFHDVEIRIRNLEVMRQRIEALLAQARTVEDALAVEAQLQRITAELERMRGRQRFLADRIALSTITVMFRPRPRELVGQPDIFELPFAWLDQLGLSTLLDLR
jgi:hypothetical protein